MRAEVHHRTDHTRGFHAPTQLTTWSDRRELAANQRALNAIHVEARKAAARVLAAGYVTHLGLQQLGMLTQMESELVSRAPLCEGRFRVVVDAFALTVAGEVQELRWRVAGQCG